MKNQYIGDVGDYGKYGLLRYLAGCGITVGVNWYLTENDGSKDGRFINYLKEPMFRKYDPELFDKLEEIAEASDKTVQMIQESKLIPNALFYSELLNTSNQDIFSREISRGLWFNNALYLLDDADLVFLDPDNGLCCNGKTARVKNSEKYALPDEIVKYYNRGKNVVYYCHRGRRRTNEWEQAKGEMKQHLQDAQITGLTFHKGTQRSYIFVIHPDDYRRYRRFLMGFLRSDWGELFTEETVLCEKKKPEIRSNKVIHPQTIYIAGPFFNETEVRNIEYAERILTEKGISFFSPMRHEERSEEPGTSAWAKKIFEMDRRAIDDSDVLLVLYYGNYSDTGTAWECGYAYAVGKPIILVHTDKGDISNLMMHCGCNTNIYLDELQNYNFNELPEYEYQGRML